MKSIADRKIHMLSFFSLNLLFVATTIITVSLLESEGKYMIWIIIIPFLIIFNYVIIGRFQRYAANDNNSSTNCGRRNDAIMTELNNKGTLNNLNNIPVIDLDGKSYFFSLRSIGLLIIGAPILSFLILSFFSMEINFWVQELMARQTIFLLKFFLNINSKIQYQSEVMYPWVIYIPRNKNTFRISLECTGVHVFSIFIGIIICTPHSKAPITREDISWRKMRTFIISLLILYIFNLLRIILLIYLDYMGLPWVIIHNLINNLSGIVAAVIFFIILYKWMPEFFLSIYYIYPAIRAKIEKAKK